MGKYNSDDHYIYYHGHESLRRNGVAIIVNKRVQNAVVGCNHKNDRMSSVHFHDKPLNITVNQVYVLTSNAERAEAEAVGLWRPTRPSRANTQKEYPFHYKGLECKSRKSRDTWSNKQIWLWSTKRSRSKSNRALPRECTGYSKHPLPTRQEKTLHMDITRWSILKSDWLYSLSQRWRSSIQLAKTRPGADCGSDHDLLIAKFRLKLKKVGETTDWKTIQIWPKSNA